MPLYHLHQVATWTDQQVSRKLKSVSADHSDSLVIKIYETVSATFGGNILPGLGCIIHGLILIGKD